MIYWLPLLARALTVPLGTLEMAPMMAVLAMVSQRPSTFSPVPSR